MCGIAGHLAFPAADEQCVRRMTGALKHRGPDGEGLHASGPIALGHRRLAIIDLERGAQPMFSADGSVAIVFNGEIYNYRELRRQLSPTHQFATDSDTEVLLHLYEEHGYEMLSFLRGMFAFALWDTRKQRLFAARDCFGEKPFLYAENASGLYFASEMRAFLSAGVDVGDVDRGSLSDFLELLYIPAPATVFSHVKKLPAGHMLISDRKGTVVRRYYQPPTPGAAAFRPRRADVLQTLQEAVRLQLRSDVPIAALLSGGLDSSVVVALMARELGAGMQTFSVGFGRADDELPYARAVASRYRTRHHEILITDGIVEQVDDALAAYSEPFGDSSAVPTVAVARAVSKHVKVVLTGDGGDELFAGYERYGRMQVMPHLPVARIGALLERLPPTRVGGRLRRAVAEMGSRGALRHRFMVEVFSLAERKRLLGHPARTAALGPDVATDDLDAALSFDLGVSLPDDMLHKTDTATMHFGLESRAPLLDKEVVELAVPPTSRLKRRGGNGKLILKAAAADLVPAEVLARPKRGFGSPVGDWLRGPLSGAFRDRLAPPKARIKSWLDPKAVDGVVARTLSGRANPHQGWLLYVLECWAASVHRA